jgi:3-oxoacyl-[acyl-carrier protein] reductase
MNCLITGASRGLGKIIAQKLTQAGHRAAIHCKTSLDEARQVALTLNHALCFQAELSCQDAIDAMINALKRQWGRLDVLVNNAGITEEKLIIKTEESQWEQIMSVNLKAPMRLIKEALPLMQHNGGHIINIASYAGVKGREGLGAYAASKAGLIGLTKALAVELAVFNIRVNAVLPGFLPTSMGLGASEKAKTTALQSSLLKRFSDPSEVADFIDYLIHTQGITGQIFNIDSRIL